MQKSGVSGHQQPGASDDGGTFRQGCSAGKIQADAVGNDTIPCLNVTLAAHDHHRQTPLVQAAGQLSEPLRTPAPFRNTGTRKERYKGSPCQYGQLFLRRVG